MGISNECGGVPAADGVETADELAKTREAAQAELLRRKPCDGGEEDGEEEVGEDEREGQKWDSKRYDK